MPVYRSRTTTHGRNMAGARGLWRATGMKDGDLPYGLSLRIADKLTGGDVTVTLIKDGDHRLSREDDLAQIRAAVAALSAKAGF